MTEADPEDLTDQEQEPDEPDQGDDWRDPDEEYARMNPGYPDPEDQGADGESGEPSTWFYVFQAFLVPVIVIGGILLMFVGLRWLFSAGYSAEELVQTIKQRRGRMRTGMIRNLISRLSRSRNLQQYRSDGELKGDVFTLLQNARSDRRKRNLIVLLGVLEANDPEIMRELSDILQNARDEKIQIAVLKSMGDIGDSFFREDVQSYISHEDPGLRQAAVYAAGQIRSPAFLASLRKALTDRFAHVRLNAAMALSQYRNLADETVREVLVVLEKMLDRNTLEGMGQPDHRGERKKLDREDINLMMVGAVQAIRDLKQHGLLHLKSQNLLPKIKAISESNRSSRHLRREARRTISVLRSDQS